MFYKMIENKCTQWYESERCTVKNLIEYIEKTGQMRDAQIEAIKVYLFLKIACECKPLTQLFRQGFFNSIDLNEIELSKSTREYLFQNPAAATLFEYACLTNDKGEQVSEKLEKQIKKDPTGIDYNEFFRNAFYGVSYTDYGIMRSGFGTPSMAELNAYTEQLKVVYEKITYEKGGSRYFSSKYNKKLVEANIRKAFCDKTDFNTTEELIPEEANLLNIANFTSEIYADNLDDYYPRQNVVENIMADDQGKLKVDKKTQQLIDLAIETGNDRIVLELQQRVSSHPNKNRSFHYLPYRTDSGFEQTFLREVLSFDIIEELGLEVYYNGDRAMTEFKIKCYKKTSGKWNYIGIYTPDFLIIKRKDGVIHKVIVVETKGQIYAKDPVFKDKKNFMETEFSKQNNAAYGYERFDYLYLEDTMPEKDRLTQTHQKICEFFKEKA